MFCNAFYQRYADTQEEMHPGILHRSIFLAARAWTIRRPTHPDSSALIVNLEHIAKHIRTFVKRARFPIRGPAKSTKIVFLIGEPSVVHSPIRRRSRRFSALGVEMRATPCAPFLAHPPNTLSVQNINVQPARPPGLADLTAVRPPQQGHVHAPYTSPGSGVAVGLKGRYTHHELRWGRPTGSTGVGVGDSTPPMAHPSRGMKKIERQRETRRGVVEGQRREGW